MTIKTIAETIAGELQVPIQRVSAAIDLLDQGATVPFIARYRKEATEGLDDGQLRHLAERLGYLRELADRKGVILKSIGEQGKLTADLERSIQGAETKSQLEDLYLPYKPKRRTKAQIAREAGLEPLAERLLADPGLETEQVAQAFIDADKGIADVSGALDGARQILMERFSEDAELIGELRDFLWQNAIVRSSAVEGKGGEGAKFADYFEYAEPIRSIPSHRALALFRGRNEGVLTLELDPGGEDGNVVCEGRVAKRFGIADKVRPGDAWLVQTVRWAWKIKLFTHLDLELKLRLREAAEEEAIRVFGLNLKDLLLAPPAGRQAIIGLDPGLRTGVKVAVVDTTGKVIATNTLYPHVPYKRWDQAIEQLAQHARSSQAGLVAIGNGTGSRETADLVDDLIMRHPELRLHRVVVSEAGASVYSASELAASELPGLDVSLRGAVSIARRLQDPLAELVKIDPKAIGVGQYQHDVNQSHLARKLDAVVEDCVNAVGVDVNTASPALLSRVSGLTRSQADNIVAYRDSQGRFVDRTQLKLVPRLGEKTFEQAAGFLRVLGGDNPLDASAVHPEAYPVVERILLHHGKSIGELMGDSALLRTLKPAELIDDRFGIPTVTDILQELEKPGRDPRGEFRTASFTEGVTDITHLMPGMVLEGTVTNVANFGAFVDLGVHQDGLVHISALSHKFVKDPREVVRTGDLVKVKVMDVDLIRKRIALSMRLDDMPNAEIAAGKDARSAVSPPRQRTTQAPTREAPKGAMAQALASALKKE